jgi:hypothetical protein
MKKLVARPAQPNYMPRRSATSNSAMPLALAGVQTTYQAGVSRRCPFAWYNLGVNLTVSRAILEHKHELLRTYRAKDPNTNGVWRT